MESISTPILVDLHRHQDTSHSPESISRIARLLHIESFEHKSIEEIRRQVQAPTGATWEQWYNCLKEVRKAYVSVVAVAELTRDVIKDAAKEGLAILELRVSLLSAVDAIRTNNTTEAQANFWNVARRTLEAILEAKRQETASSEMVVDLILSISCQNKYLSYIHSYVDLMKDYSSDIIAVDLTNEQENKPTTYRADLERIRPHIQFLTVHCMEKMGPDRGWDALELAPDRIGHGIRAVEDPLLVQEIARKAIPLEICPLSNILTSVASPQNHPFRRLNESGVRVTINHDGLNDVTLLKDDYAFVKKTFGYDDQDMLRFMQNGWESAFLNMKRNS